jgi:hypothetical protein
VAGRLGFGSGHSQLVIPVNWEFDWLVYLAADLIGGWTDWRLDRLVRSFSCGRLD